VRFEVLVVFTCVSIAFDGGMHFDFPMKVPGDASAIDTRAQSLREFAQDASTYVALFWKTFFPRTSNALQALFDGAATSSVGAPAH
jgi:hypothetical protein